MSRHGRGTDGWAGLDLGKGRSVAAFYFDRDLVYRCEVLLDRHIIRNDRQHLAARSGGENNRCGQAGNAILFGCVGKEFRVDLDGDEIRFKGGRRPSLIAELVLQTVAVTTIIGTKKQEHQAVRLACRGLGGIDVRLPVEGLLPQGRGGKTRKARSTGKNCCALSIWNAFARRSSSLTLPNIGREVQYIG